MKRHILRYALYGAAILGGFNLIMLLIFGIPDADSFSSGEVIGYAVIVVSLLTVYFGMRSYRDAAAPGAFGFGTALLVGLGITLGPALFFGLYNLAYVLWIDPQFADKYTAYLLEKASNTMTEAELQEYAVQLESQQELFLNPWMMMLVMFVTVFLIGVVISIISAMILRRRRTAAA